MRRFQLLLLSFVFIGTLLSSFHYHDDMQTADDCQVCIIQHGLAGADIPEPSQLQVIETAAETPHVPGSSAFIAKAFTAFSPRAPPLFS